MTPSIEPEFRAARIAPALRMLLQADQPSSIVVFQPGSSHLGGEQAAFIPCMADLEAQYREIEKGIRRYTRKHGRAPHRVAVERVGLFAWGRSKAAAEQRLAGGEPAAPAESPGKAREPRFHDRIAIVTGAGQGIGAGIAEKLAGEGAYVVLADIAEDQAQERVREIRRAHGRDRACAKAVDVSDESSIENLVLATAREYGGIDIFVSNAGIVRAGSIEELPREEFERVARINYTAFFLCCKHASRIMRIQNRFDLSRCSDIVLINSKTGLVGSKRNFAYAGSKFGGIGLVQSIALELAAAKIKVNAICPGNYLEGPLWSDPNNGLLVQYLKADKVAGAKTVDDVRRFYENEAPMRRSCKIEDIFRALAYVIEQVYETGQAVPVTGGQMMLK